MPAGSEEKGHLSDTSPTGLRQDTWLANTTLCINNSEATGDYSEDLEFGVTGLLVRRD